MVTIFSTPKPFQGHNAVIQRNALESWKRLHADAEVILFGDEPGAAEACAELGIRHEPKVERSHIHPRLPVATYLFNRAQEIARHPWLCYLNCDNILMGDFCEAVKRVSEWRKSFLLVGKQWGLDISKPIDFRNAHWEEELRVEALKRGARREWELDYFAFPKGMYLDMPPLIVGRIYWDYWMVWKARSVSAPVVDASSAVVVVHQNHEAAYVREPKARLGIFVDPGAKWNYELAGSGRNLYDYDGCSHVLTRRGEVVRTIWRGQRRKLKQFLWRVFIQRTAPLRSRFGLRRETLRRIMGKSTTAP